MFDVRSVGSLGGLGVRTMGLAVRRVLVAFHVELIQLEVASLATKATLVPEGAKSLHLVGLTINLLLAASASGLHPCHLVSYHCSCLTAVERERSTVKDSSAATAA